MIGGVRALIPKVEADIQALYMVVNHQPTPVDSNLRDKPHCSHATTTLHLPTTTHNHAATILHTLVAEGSTSTTNSLSNCNIATGNSGNVWFEAANDDAKMRIRNGV